MSLLLFLLYPLAIQYERGGYWKAVLPITFVALVIDVYCNYTELALLTWDWPRDGEWTFSMRCKRMKVYEDTWGGKVALFIEPYLDFWAPSGNHI